MSGDREPIAGRMLIPGDELSGGYRVVRKLGVGGMGAVYEVESEELGGRCAMKVMLPDLASDPEFKARFDREAKISSLIESEYVARVLEIGTLEDARPFMTMELLDGNDLELELRSKGALPYRDVVTWVIQACDALHEAHRQSVIHRDLKPANLFLTRKPDGTRIVKVLDFGISKKLGSGLHGGGDGPTLTQTDAMLGSPKYMSPEQVRSAKHLDARSDIWSLGVILYKLVADSLPFDGDSLGAYVSMIIADAPRPLEVEAVPKELVSVVMRCLEKDPGKRPQTVARLTALLAPFASPAAQPVIDRLRAAEPSAFSAPLAEETVSEPARRLDPTISEARMKLGLRPVAAGGESTGSQAIAEAQTSSRMRDKPTRSRWSLPLIVGSGIAVLGVGVAIYLGTHGSGSRSDALAGAPIQPAPASSSSPSQSAAPAINPAGALTVASGSPSSTLSAAAVDPGSAAPSASAPVLSAKTPPDVRPPVGYPSPQVHRARPRGRW